ncbi:DUF883 family protein [Patescibacteria group bacterium]|nr:DUF883 family protein [Patescibacteria group bacterium]
MDNTNMSENNAHQSNSSGNTPMQKANEVASEMKQEVEKYVDAAKQQWNDVTDEVKKKGEMVKEDLTKARKYAEDYARENPWKVVGIAAGIGALAALLLRGCGRTCRRHHEE